MKLLNKTAVRISLTIFVAIATVFLIIAIIGNKKANSLIEEFPNEFKKDVKLYEFKELSSALRTSKVAAFIAIRNSNEGFFMFDFEYCPEVRDYLLKALDTKDKEFFLKGKRPNEIYKCESVDFEISSKAIANIGFVAKIGFLFKGNQAVKTINEISGFIHKRISKNIKCEFKLVILSIPDEENVKAYEVIFNQSEEFEFGSSKSFKFEPNKDINADSYEYVSSLIIKVTKGKFTNMKKYRIK
ncbi:hypothetical protein CWI39_1121p0010 [Hamiltosporidium magnivora]|uniref:Uncharacterized protein n=1 Tax=Hamiltosporidium magnivora TaxID=148818 RepID=A0A4Q9L7G6_9MICR|nr:hypothetical protein CWI39_1121p0010 [Hamiltosporidium magnivora]